MFYCLFKLNGIYGIKKKQIYAFDSVEIFTKIIFLRF